MQINWDFFKSAQTKWGIIIFVIAICGKIFGFYDNIITLWEATKNIQNHTIQIQENEKTLCQSVKFQKSVVISNSSLFNALLMTIPQKDTQSIEIIKQIAKTQLETQADEIRQLIGKCNV